VSIGLDEYAEFVGSSEPVRPRVEHACMACRERIPPGVLCLVIRSLFEGRWSSEYRCARCELLYRAICARFAQPGPHRDYDDGVDPYLDCGHTWRENYGEDPPNEVQRLAFMTAAEVASELEREADLLLRSRA